MLKNLLDTVSGVGWIFSVGFAVYPRNGLTKLEFFCLHGISSIVSKVRSVVCIFLYWIRFRFWRW